MDKEIILASSSPRRYELLKKIVNDFKVIPSNKKEEFPLSLEALKVSLYLSNIKALDIYSKHNDSIVIGADTSIVIDNKVIGKPIDKEDAKRMLQYLSNKMHYVISGVTIYCNNNKYEINSINKVYFKELKAEEIDEYLMIDEYKDKAGSYAIQGVGSKFIAKYEGEYESIMGLPIKELANLLNDLASK
jgi:septum formation protein